MLKAVILVRHAKPVVDPRVHRSKWPIGDEGKEAARQLAESVSRSVPDWPVLCSTERKAIETAAHLASEGTSPLVLSGLAEVEHPWYEDHEDHQRLALEYLAGGGLERWEPAGDAVRRFAHALERAGSARVVAVSHGTVMALWAQTVVNRLDAAAFWKELSMPDAWLVDLDRSTIDRLAQRPTE